MADRSVQKTTHVSDTVLRLLPAFSSKRECVFSLRLVDGLLHPITLGTDFWASHGIDILFSAKSLEWDDIRIPMTDLLPKSTKAVAADTNIDSLVEVAVSELVEALEPLSMIDGEMLSERVEVENLVKAFLHVCSGGLGKIKYTPYVIPLKPGAKPFTCRPYSIPQLHLEVKLDVLFPDNTSERASSASVIPTKDAPVRIVCDYHRYCFAASTRSQ